MANTFLHISDLHIGDVDLVTRASRSDRRAVAAVNLYQYLPGNLGHSDAGMRAVKNLYLRLRRKFGQDSVRVIVSGDITAFGKPEHFATAEEFLYGQYPTGPYGRHRLGLSIGRAAGVIPGNHDYFAGDPIPAGYLSPQFANFFSRPLPSLSWVEPLPDGRRLRFLEIDCDHDFELAGTFPRITAREAGENHLGVLDGRLIAMNRQDEPRILIMHGSPTHQDGILKICETMFNTQNALDRFCRRHKVKAILCGHTHSTYLGTIPWPNGLPSTEELRCGTSMQVMKPKINLVSKRLLRRYLPKVHQALVHRILSRRGKVYWETQEYFRREDLKAKFQASSATRRFEL